MIKYQVSDECYGSFGDIYATEAEAQEALEYAIGEFFTDTAEGMAIREEQDAEASYRQPREITHAEIVAEIRQSLFINEIEIADPEPEQADEELAEQVERERLAWNAAAIRLTTHPY